MIKAEKRLKKLQERGPIGQVTLAFTDVQVFEIKKNTIFK
jgi:hypothetical protein